MTNWDSFQVHKDGSTHANQFVSDTSHKQKSKTT